LSFALYLALICVVVAFVGGVVYYAWYKKNVLDKVFSIYILLPRLDITQIEQAFQGGYDPALELAIQARHSLENRHTADATEDVEVMHDPLMVHLRRKEQDIIDRIIHGDEGGRYFLILGCKVSLFDIVLCFSYQRFLYTGHRKDDHDIGFYASQPGRRCLHV
jgi:hypothetical protein